MFQISWKLEQLDGVIVMVNNETKDGFKQDLEALGLYERTKEVLFRIATGQGVANVAPSNTQPTPTANPQTDAERVILPDDATLEIVWKGDKYHGEISPFPGTKYHVYAWPEVLENLEGFDKDTTRSMNVGGFEVDFVRNDKGYPNKVVAFV